MVLPRSESLKETIVLGRLGLVEGSLPVRDFLGMA
jgi:hypothetical protein